MAERTHRSTDADTIEPMGGNVFISYRRENLDFANQIVALLEDEGYDPKIDREDIEATEDWAKRLGELIGSCDTVVFVLTDAYVASKNCEWEINKALEKGKRLIPVVPDPLTKPVPEALSKLNYIYFFNLKEGDGTGFYAGFKSLKRALRHDLERLRLRRRYDDRSAAWLAGEGDLLSGDQLVQAESWQTAASAVEGVPEVIADYILASRAAQTKREARQRMLNVALGTLSVAAIVASAFAGLTWVAAKQAEAAAVAAQTDAAEKTEKLKVAETDSENLVDAAQRWATASQFLGQNTFETYTFPDEPPLDVTDSAAATLSQAQQAIDLIKGSDGAQIRAIRNAIRRDLGKARYYNHVDTAVEPLDLIIADSSELPETSSQPDETQALQARLMLAKDYMARAVYSCLLETRRGAIRDDLAAAPQDVKSAMSWKTVRRLARTDDMCSEAREAICAIATDCPGSTEDRLASNEAPGAPAPQPEKPVADPAFQVTQLFLHIADESQRSDAAGVKARLEATGKYVVLGIELVKSEDGRNRSVRYYYDQQAAQADALAQICAGLAPADRPGWGDAASYRRISLAGRYDGLPTNRAEIWF